MSKQALRVGIGGPVGSGKTALTLALCQALRDQVNMAVVTNDIYTAEDAKFLVQHSALAPERIIFNPGTEHAAFAERAAEQGSEVVEGCTLVMLGTGQY